MSLVLNTNISALIAQSNLTTSGNQLTSALTQLSSGLRVNSAADDAAGYAIAQGMTAQIGGLNQASRNANDGVSLAQTASGALQEVVNDLQTMRDLAVQSLNATNSTTDRADLNAQYSQLMADINNVSANTQFNGVNLLDGTFQGASFQVGANVGQTITVGSIASSSANAIGNFYQTAGQSTYGLTAAADNNTSVGLSIVVTPNSTATPPGAASDPINLTVALTGDATTDLKTEAAAINQAIGSKYGVTATVNSAGTGIDLSSAGSGDTNVAISLDNSILPSGTTANTTATDTTALGIDATYDVGAGASAAAGAAWSAKNLSNTDVTSVDNANLVLTSIDNALQQLATSSANLGAYQNRFQAAISGLSTNSTNLTSAKSSIVDTDYASATSALSKAQILQQAGTAMVAQANTIPQNIMTLLQKLP